ncbi:MAG TPA: hypothetical protein VJ994_10060 [Paracoccaceae bacterium]|nr:hypothetical protein [Paracoccaceae bacterium]
MSGAPDTETPPRARTPVTGRTPADAAAEIAGSLFALLGSWTLPLLVLALLGAGWWFVEEQNRLKDEAYDEALSQLRAERDAAYAVIATNNEAIADVTSKQIGNLSSVLGVIDEAELRGARVRQLEDAARERQAELDRSRERVERAEAELESRTRAFERTRKEAEQRQESLRTSAERLASLEAAFLAVETAARADLQAAVEKVAEAGGMLEEIAQGSIAPSDPRVTAALESLWVYVFTGSGSAGLDAAKQRYADVVLDPAQILMPFAELEGWRFDVTGLDQLIGVSQTRLEERITQTDGFGFDAWIRVRFAEAAEDAGLSGHALAGLVRDGVRDRLLVLYLYGDAEDDLRVGEHAMFEAIAPARGLSKLHAAVEVVAEAYLHLGYVQTEEHRIALPPEADSVPVMDLTAQSIAAADLLHGDDATVPLLGPDAFAAVAIRPDLPPALRDAFDPNFGDVGVSVSMLRARPEFESRLAGALLDAGLDEIDGLSAAVAKAFRDDLGAPPRPVAELDATADYALPSPSPSALALQPGFRVFLELDAPPPAFDGSDGRTRAPAPDPDRERRAVIRVASDWQAYRFPAPLEMTFALRPGDPAWRLVPSGPAGGSGPR